MPGPVPKRSTERRRRNKESQVTVTEIPRSEDTEGPEGPPPVDSDWHEGARRVYESLAKSGQSKFYEPSDHAFAWVVCDLLSAALFADKPNANLIAACFSGLDRLLVTEGDRRRARMEFDRPQPNPVESPGVAIMARYRHAAGND